MAPAPPQILDVAVVGAGIAGVYCAARMCENARARDLPHPMIGVFEKEAKLGGRLLDVPLPGTGFNAPLGGMRVRPNQRLVMSLIHSLARALPPELSRHLVLRPFSFERLRYALRGHIFAPDGGDGPANQCPYRVDDEERGMDATQLVLEVTARALSELRALPQASAAVQAAVERIAALARTRDWVGLRAIMAEEWPTVIAGSLLKNRQLTSLGFQNLLAHYLSAEGWRFVYDSFGYETITQNWSCGIALPWFLNDFAVSEFEAPAGGLELLPQLMWHSAAHPDMRLFAEHELVALHGIRHGSEKLVLLEFAGQQTYLARSVILTLPPLALTKIALSGLRTNGETTFDEDANAFGKALSSVTPRVLCKLFAGFEGTPWAPLFGGPKGRVISDSPLGQLYFYGPTEQARRTKREMGMVQIYNDGQRSEFFEMHLQNRQVPYYGGDTVLMEEELLVVNTYGTSIHLVEKIQLLLNKLLGQRSIVVPRPIVVIGKHYKDGWYTWSTRASDPEAIMNHVAQPFRGHRIFICGEAFSTEQGWIEGSLQSAERVLCRIERDELALHQGS